MRLSQFWREKLPRILYPAKLFQGNEEEIKIFSEEQKLREFNNTWPILKEVLKGILQTERNTSKFKKKSWKSKMSWEPVFVTRTQVTFTQIILSPHSEKYSSELSELCFPIKCYLVMFPNSLISLHTLLSGRNLTQRNSSWCPIMQTVYFYNTEEGKLSIHLMC